MKRPARWKTIRIDLRCRRTGIERSYPIETKRGWRDAERKARKLAEADGMVDPEDRGGSWENCPHTRPPEFP